MLKLLCPLMLPVLLIVAGPAPAAAVSPEDVVRQLYPRVPGEGNPVIDLKSEVSPCLVCFASDVIERDENGLQAIFTDPLASFLKRWAQEEGVWVLECVDFEPLVHRFLHRDKAVDDEIMPVDDGNDGREAGESARALQ
ncbi:MAG: hypothetical protein P8Z31_04355 [Gammaproteobacteria bacterium]